MGGPLGAPVVDPAQTPRRSVWGQLLPEGGRGVEQEEVHVAPGRQRAQHIEVAGGQPGETEHGEALGEIGQGGVLPQPPAGLAQALGGARGPDPVVQPAPDV